MAAPYRYGSAGCTPRRAGSRSRCSRVAVDVGVTVVSDAGLADDAAGSVIGARAAADAGGVLNPRVQAWEVAVLAVGAIGVRRAPHCRGARATVAEAASALAPVCALRLGVACAIGRSVPISGRRPVRHAIAAVAVTCVVTFGSRTAGGHAYEVPVARSISIAGTAEVAARALSSRRFRLGAGGQQEEHQCSEVHPGARHRSPLNRSGRSDTIESTPAKQPRARVALRQQLTVCGLAVAGPATRTSSRGRATACLVSVGATGAFQNTSGLLEVVWHSR